MAGKDPVPILIVIFSIIWILVLAGTIIVFKFIVPLEIFHSFLDGVVKGILATILVVVWLSLFAFMRNTMVKRHLAPQQTQN